MSRSISKRSRSRKRSKRRKSKSKRPIKEKVWGTQKKITILGFTISDLSYNLAKDVLAEARKIKPRIGVIKKHTYLKKPLYSVHFSTRYLTLPQYKKLQLLHKKVIRNLRSKN